MVKKFRAWSIKDKGWVAGFNMVNYHGYFNKGLKPSIHRYDTEWEDGEYELEQFVGLKDCKGQEIFEGDAFEVTDGDGWVVGVHVAKIDHVTLEMSDDCVGLIRGNIHEGFDDTVE